MSSGRCPLDAATAQDVSGRDLFGDTNRVREPVGQQRDTEAEANVLGRLRQRADDHLWGRAMRTAGTEMMLDEPARVEAVAVGHFTCSMHSLYARCSRRRCPYG